jgi:hypothetical protein
MSIELARIFRVIIAGEWYTVERGTFEIVEMNFVDEIDQPTHPPTDMLAYHFLTPNMDEYWGPLAAIELIKLMDIEN